MYYYSLRSVQLHKTIRKSVCMTMNDLRQLEVGPFLFFAAIFFRCNLKLRSPMRYGYFFSLSTISTRMYSRHKENERK